MSRTIINCDSVEWFNTQSNLKCIVTSPPDLDEIGLDWTQYQEWTTIICENMIKSLAKKSIVIFYLTDRKYNGVILDKKSFITNIFIKNGFHTCMSKIVLRQQPGTSNMYRQGYTNLFGFSRFFKSGKVTPDVIERGEMLYNNGMGFNSCQVCCDFIKEKKFTDTIIDPFCGRGSMIIVGNNNGFNMIGIDIDSEQTKLL